MIAPEANAAFVAAMEDVLEVYQRLRDPERPLVCFDETSKQLVIETRQPIPAKPGKPARHDHEYERNGVANLFMMFAPLEGWRRHCHVWMYMDPARLQAGLANSGPRVTTADVYPASLCGLNDRRREPRWIFARFHLNGAKALAEAMPVQTPGSGSDGVTVSPSSANRCNC